MAKATTIPDAATKEMVTVYLLPEAAKRLRVHAAVSRRSMSDTVTQLVLEHLDTESTQRSAA